LALILIGSGLYWILSSQLIFSFTAFAPGLLQTVPYCTSLVTVVGVIVLGVGLWIAHVDFDELGRLFVRSDGWVFTVPIALVVSDTYLTLVALSFSSQIVELNPFVASAIQFGASALFPFVLSYLALSEGLALLMLNIGDSLFGASKPNSLPFALICGAASFGPFSNLLGLAFGYVTSMVYVLGLMGAGLLAALVYRTLTNARELLHFSC
jgi:hypothetical protein